MRVVFTEHAAQELAEAISYLNGEREGLGTELRGEVLAALRRIRDTPQAFQPLDERFRRCRTQGFRYGLIYSIEGEQIIIHAVMHLHRRPDYWRDRG